MSTLPVALKMTARASIAFVILLFVGFQPGWASDALDSEATAAALAERAKFIGAQGDVPLASVRVEGLERTRAHVVEREFEPFYGQQISSLDLEAVLRQLYRKGIFSSIHLRFLRENDQGSIVVTASDKWTFIPIPVYTATRNEQRYGLFLLDTNLFGRHKSAIIGGTLSNTGWHVLAGYDDHYLFNSNFTTRQGTEFGERLNENGRPDGTVIETYRTRFSLLSHKTGYKFRNGIKLRLFGTFRSYDVVPDSHLNSARAQSAQALGEGIDFMFERLRHRGYYEEGFVTQTFYLHGFPVGETGVVYDRVKTRSRYTLNPWSNHSLSFSLLGDFADMTPVFEQRLGGLEGSRTLPANLIAADRYTSLTTRYEYPLAKPSWGVFTLAHFIEAGGYQLDQNQIAYFYGPGMGVRFYLKNLAIPAFGLDVAYEVQSRQVQASFALGLVR